MSPDMMGDAQMQLTVGASKNSASSAFGVQASGSTAPQTSVSPPSTIGTPAAATPTSHVRRLTITSCRRGLEQELITAQCQCPTTAASSRFETHKFREQRS